MSLSKKTKIKNFIRKSVVILTTLFFCIIILEIGLRAIGHKPTNVIEGYFEQHGDSYRLKSNITKIRKTPSYTCTVHINSFGFRDIKPGDRDIGDKPYYVFLGESLVFGNGVDYEQSFVGTFAELAKKHGIEVFNLAVGGHRFSEQKALLIDFVNSMSKSPSAVIVCASPLFIEKFNKEHFKYLIKDGYIFKKDRFIIPYIKVMLSNSSSTYCFIRDRIRRLQVKLIGPYKGNITQFLQMYSKNNRMMDSTIRKEFQLELAKLENYIHSLDAIPIYVYTPLIPSYNLNNLITQAAENPEDYNAYLYSNLMKEHCEKHKIKFIDLNPILQKYYYQGKQLTFKLDQHYNAFAHDIIGKYLYERILGDSEN